MLSSLAVEPILDFLSASAVPRSARSLLFMAAQAICSGWRSRVSESSTITWGS